MPFSLQQQDLPLEMIPGKSYALLNYSSWEQGGGGERWCPHSRAQAGDVAEGGHKVGEEPGFREAGAEHGTAPSVAVCTVHIHRPALFVLRSRPLRAFLELFHCESCRRMLLSSVR